MANAQVLSSDQVFRNLDAFLPDLEALYKDVHSHPELSMQETRTAGLAADRLRAAGKIDIVLPVEANAVFVRLSEQLALDLQSRGWHFYKFIEPDVYRLMCSWATTDAEIDRLTADMLR